MAGDCERVVREVASAGSDAGATGPDTAKPRVRAGAVTLQQLGRRGLVRVFATSTEAGAIAGSGFVEMGGVRLPLRTDRRAVVGRGRRRRRLTARLSAAAMREARRALRRRRKVMVAPRRRRDRRGRELLGDPRPGDPADALGASHGGARASAERLRLGGCGVVRCA